MRAAIAILCASCAIDPAPPDDFEGGGFEVRSGTVRLSDEVVRVTEGCDDGRVVVRADGTWSCADRLFSRAHVDAAIAAAVADLSDCPSGYTRDTGAAADIVVCARGADEMVKVGDFWVDRYEASVWAESTCTGGGPFGATGHDYPPGFPDTGHATTPLYACSVRDVTPSQWLTWLQAAQACAAAGKRLITNAEWQTAAAGTVDPDAHDGILGGPCHTDGPLARVTGMAGADPGGGNGCISRWGAEDMVGNLWEWTALWDVEVGTNGVMSTWDAAGFGGDGYWHGGEVVEANAGEPGSHEVMVGSESGARLPAVTMRGGSGTSGSFAGVFHLNVSQSPSSARAWIGFRCARR